MQMLDNSLNYHNNAAIILRNKLRKKLIIRDGDLQKNNNHHDGEVTIYISIMADFDLFFLPFKDKFNNYVQTMW